MGAYIPSLNFKSSPFTYGGGSHVAVSIVFVSIIVAIAVETHLHVVFCHFICFMSLIQGYVTYQNSTRTRPQARARIPHPPPLNTIIRELNPFPTKDIYIHPPSAHSVTKDIYIRPHANEISKSLVLQVGLKKLTLVVEKVWHSIYKRVLSTYIHFAGLLIFRTVVDRRNSGTSAKSCEITKKSEITRNTPDIFPNTCRQNIFNTYLGY